MILEPCRRCDQRIWWAETERGKKIPVNAWTSPHGNVIPIDPEADVPLVHFLTKTEEPPAEGTRRYISHLTTCKKRRR